MTEFLSTIPMCSYFGKPWLVGMSLLGNLLVFFAYMAIPIAIEIVRRLRGLPFNGLAAMFALFIMLCGVGHLVHMAALVTNHNAWHWVVTVVDLLTGLVSVITAIWAFKAIPMMMEIPTPEQHEMNQERLEIYKELERWRQTGKPYSEPNVRPLETRWRG
jgi:hypothetical protein